ncbi:MAG: type II toxin-antitoxin system RelB/DinJ family antitoxin [Succinivibrionaceae bacterium]|nr:type II toxin-antitoxin system RelB/DinJ family antitoxin [Succinivibrionaceae bacterium]
MGKTIKVNFRIDSDLKKQVDELAKKLHMSFSALMNVYAAQLVREQKIPFEISALPARPSEDRKADSQQAFFDGIEGDDGDDEIIGDGVTAEQMKNWLKK